MVFSKITAVFSAVVLIGATALHAAAKSLTIQCTDSTKVQIRELIAESSHRYPYGDFLEVGISNARTGQPNRKYRIAAAGTGSFGGRWVYVGPPGRNFSLLLSGKSPVWYLEFDGQKALNCARI